MTGEQERERESTLGRGHTKTAHACREDVLTRKVQECDVFVPILSLEYEESVWCLGELKLALNLKKAIIPIWHSGDYPPPRTILRMQVGDIIIIIIVAPPVGLWSPSYG